MTCIIYKDGVFYSDSQTSYGTEREQSTDKVIIQYQHPYVVAYGFSGDASAKFYAEKNFPLHKDDFPEIPAGIQYNAIKVIYNTKTKKSIIYNISTATDSLHINRIKESYYCVGSGATFARGALKAGASPFRALQIAIECDIHCAKPIKTYALKDYIK